MNLREAIRMATPRRALAEPFDAGYELRPRIQEGRPRVGQLTREPRHRIAERGDVDRKRGRRRYVELERAGGRRHCERDALAAEQRTDLRDHPAHARHRRLKRRVVQAFRELRGAGAEAEHEASARHRVQRRRGHRDGRRAAVPDAEDAGPERDSRRARRRLGEQHGYVVRPRLRQEEAVVAEAITLGGETDDRLAPCLQRHDGETDSRAHGYPPARSGPYQEFGYAEINESPRAPSAALAKEPVVRSPCRP